MREKTKKTKKTNYNVSFQKLQEKIAYIHYIVCRKMTWKEYHRMNSI